MAGSRKNDRRDETWALEHAAASAKGAVERSEQSGDGCGESAHRTCLSVCGYASVLKEESLCDAPNDVGEMVVSGHRIVSQRLQDLRETVFMKSVSSS